MYTERKRDSNKQWLARDYCSVPCNNRSKKRVTHIFERLKRFQLAGEDCWGWTGNSDGKGYGTLSNRKGAGFSPEKAHRVSYEMFYGEIPKGLNICHKCDNRECTNPKHLFAGTQKENMQDCSRKGRLNKKSLGNLIAGSKGFYGAATTKNKVK
ncbi:MAG: HNH endonuclease [Phycisphaera sp.]|nr:MAG: HNH endonuclease [Phycisphaera sp.]